MHCENPVLADSTEQRLKTNLYSKVPYGNPDSATTGGFS